MSTKKHTSMGHGLNGAASDEKHVVLRLDEIEFDPSFNTRIGVGSEAQVDGKDDADWSTFVESFDVNAQNGGEVYTLNDTKKPVYETKDGEPVCNGTPTRPFAGIKQDVDVIIRPNDRKGARKAFSAIDGFRRELAIRSVYRMYGVPVKDQTIRAVVKQLNDLDALAENIRANQDRRPLTGKELTLAVSRYTAALDSAGYIKADVGAQPTGVKVYTAGFLATKLGISRTYAKVHLDNAVAMNSLGKSAAESMRKALTETAVDIPVRGIEAAAKQVTNLVKDGKLSATEAGPKLIEIARQSDQVQRTETRKAAKGGDVSAKWKAWQEAAKAYGHRLGVAEADGLCTVNGRALTDPSMVRVWANVNGKDDIALIESATNDSKQVVLKAAGEGYQAGIAAAKEAQAKRAASAAKDGKPAPSTPASETKGKGKNKGKGAHASAN